MKIYYYWQVKKLSNLNWIGQWIQRYICEIYSRLQLESIGFRFGKCARDKKITSLAVDTLEKLLIEVPRGIIIIIPNRDLSSDFAIINEMQMLMRHMKTHR